MKFQTYREGGEREEERRGKGKEKGRKEREKGRRGRRRERGLVQVTEVVGTCMYTRNTPVTFIFLKFLVLNEYRDLHTYTSSSEKPCTVVQRYTSTQ